MKDRIKSMMSHGITGLERVKGGYTLATIPRTITPYRDSVEGTRNHVTYQKLDKQ
jgi:hypothetical protein